MTKPIKQSRRYTAVTLILAAASIVLFIGCLLHGSVDIPTSQVMKVLSGQHADKAAWDIIILHTRLPMACTAALAGTALAISGLLLQTTFDNPLAGPSVLGISTGSSVGVAVVMLAFGGVIGNQIGTYAAILSGAFIGAGVIILMLLLFSSMIKSSVMLLIVGIMIGYLASSAISLLNFFSTQEGVHSFVIWGLGNFSGITLDRLPVFAISTLLLTGMSFLLIKPLNALLLGSRYAENLGVNIRSTRNRLLFISGSLTAVVTAFCGPIGFIGLVVPHIARLALRTSNHSILLPVTALTGAATGLLCAFVSIIPASAGIVPINAITPIIGFPIVLYIILNRKKILYFN
ncbi:MAG: iron ABC transporter permease [Muribaculaceae bacterium]|nr:iron ABC transporter permease [Muribaculaceae bacterium]